MNLDELAVVFDIGGVLADWDPEYAFGERIQDPRRRKFFLNEVCGDEWLAGLNRGSSFAKAIDEWQTRFPEWKSEISAYPSLWRDMIAGSIPGMEDLFQQIRSVGHRVYVFTNHPAETFDTTLSALPFINSADGVFVSGSERLAKPDMHAFAAIELRFGLIPNSTVLVDDEGANVLAAQSRGWSAILFRGESGLRRTLEKAGILPDG